MDIIFLIIRILMNSQDGEYAFNTSEPVARFLKIRPSDRGLYNCIATNSLGSSNASSSGLLTIEGKLTIYKQLSFTTVSAHLSII